jgi:hypothetical protein
MLSIYVHSIMRVDFATLGVVLFKPELPHLAFHDLWCNMFLENRMQWGIV